MGVGFYIIVNIKYSNLTLAVKTKGGNVLFVPSLPYFPSFDNPSHQMMSQVPIQELTLDSSKLSLLQLQESD